MDSDCMKQMVNPYRECRKQAAIYNRALSSISDCSCTVILAVSDDRIR